VTQVQLTLAPWQNSNKYHRDRCYTTISMTNTKKQLESGFYFRDYFS
jgi:hypothetical protein